MIRVFLNTNNNNYNIANVRQGASASGIIAEPLEK